MPASFPARSGMALISGCTTRFDASHGNGLPRIVSLMPRRRASIDTGPPPAICTLPPTSAAIFMVPLLM